MPQELIGKRMFDTNGAEPQPCSHLLRDELNIKFLLSTAFSLIASQSTHKASREEIIKLLKVFMAYRADSSPIRPETPEAERQESILRARNE
jgi:hypothetical protein